jgi:hypothetical protein
MLSRKFCLECTFGKPFFPGEAGQNEATYLRQGCSSCVHVCSKPVALGRLVIFRYIRLRHPTFLPEPRRQIQLLSFTKQWREAESADGGSTRIACHLYDNLELSDSAGSTIFNAEGNQYKEKR